MMEEVKGLDRRGEMMNELVRGMEFAKQLRVQILNPTDSCSSSKDDNRVALNNSLLEQMLSSFDKIITLAKLLHIQRPHHPSSTIDPIHNYCHLSHEPPHSLTTNSPKSENSYPDFPTSKRRKSMMPRWTKTVQIINEGVSKGLDGALDDGFSWRKYGQKDILGAKFPRGYYRCTYRHSKGCLATKQVQRSDEDPSIYRVMYRGDHTCAQGTHLAQAQFNSMIPAQMKTEPQLAQIKAEPQLALTPQQQEVYLGLGPEGDIKVEPEQGPENDAQFLGSLSFNSVHLQPDPIDNYMLSFYPDFGSPTTSGSNYLPMMSQQANKDHNGLSIKTSETDINEVVSGPNSVSNSPVIGDFEFPLDELLDFDGNFSFEL